MLETETRGAERYWEEHGADEYADAIVAAMKLGGVDNLFFVSGSEEAFYQESIAKAQHKGWPAPRLVTMIHESVALNAAMGCAIVSGHPTATAAHVDVGTLHYGAALHSAWRGGFPVLITAGTAPRGFPGSIRGAREGSVQWLQEPRDQGEIVRQYTKMDHRMEHHDNPGMMVSRLLQVAMSEPKGPVYLSIPRETAMLPMPGVARFPTRDHLGLARASWPDPDDARAIARWLVESENPLICLGRSGFEPASVPELVRLAELLAIPVSETGLTDCVNFPATHPLFGTGPRIADADAVLVFENSSPYIPGEESPKPDAKVAWVSADPVYSRIKTLYYRADLWLTASPANVAKAVYEAATSMLNKSDLARIAARRERLETRKQELEARLEAEAQEAGRQPMPTGRWLGYQIGKLLEPETIILNEAVGNSAPVRAYANRTVPGTYFRSGSSGGGWGPGAAFGAKLAAPDRDVVLASGDGFFLFGTPEAALWAARFHSAPFLSIVFVNNTYGTGTGGLRQSYPEGYAVASQNYAGGTFAPAPDYAKLAEAVGGYGEYVSETAEVGPALQRGLAQTRNGVPAVIAVRVRGPLD